MANSTKCPAINKICKYCGKTGHFAKVCHSEHKCKVREVIIPELSVLFLNNAAPKEKKIMCTVDLGTSPAKQSFEMIVDMGSSGSLLPAHVYKTCFSHIPLKHIKFPLVTYSRQRIPVLGKTAYTCISGWKYCLSFLFHCEVRFTTAGAGLV